MTTTPPTIDADPVVATTDGTDFRDYSPPTGEKFSFKRELNKLRQKVSFQMLCLLAAGAVVAYSGARLIIAQIRTNESASINLPNKHIGRTGDSGPLLFEEALSDAGFPGQANPDTRRFLSNLNLGPDEIETVIKEVVERNRLNGIDMTTLEPLYQLAELNTNDPKSLGAVGDVKVIVSLYKVIGYRMNGEERINGLQLQASLNLPVDSNLFYTKKEGTLIVERLDGKRSPYANWLIQAVNRKPGTTR